ncbi:MAG: pyruvate, phosphate dikinase [Planctomycetes bacterium]|nr:pyruvate, phosphate dikinase [Planctomycetota bacterium]
MAKRKSSVGAPRGGRSVWSFGGGKAEGRGDAKAILGGKGAGLAEMSRLGLPVPPGFTIATTACAAWWASGRRPPKGLWPEVERALARLERLRGQTFGRGPRPLLVSVRSGAAVSMPGMMETVLNVGLTRETIPALVAVTGNERMVQDSHRRLVQMFGKVVREIHDDLFEDALHDLKRRRGARLDTDLSAADLAGLAETYRGVFRDETGEEFPDDAMEQLRQAVEAVFRSWECDKARKYRRIQRIEGLLGTAVNVQSMVFGNRGPDSGTGVCFTRDPSTGENVFFGEFLIDAQGEDVVAGIRTPEPIVEMGKHLPDAYRDLLRVKDLLERHYGDVQDIEFTVEEGRLFVLQTRTGKRTARAALRIAVDLVKEKRITPAAAVSRVDPHALDQLLHPTFDEKAATRVLARGLGASPGAAVGRAVFTADDAEAWSGRGEKVILVRAETSPEDVGGMHAADGILTSRGGLTSHAAVVARGWGKCCVVGCAAVSIDARAKSFTAGEETVREGDWISLDGSEGRVMLGRVPTVRPALGADFATLMAWADRFRRLGVRTNADTPEDARAAREFGAEGIGLCRTEHMFFATPERIRAVREMILADSTEGRSRALEKLLPIQRGDFEGIFGAMDGLPVTIRLLDPPLHEFVPHEEAQQEEMAREMGVSAADVERRVRALHEANPMLGHRGCRLGITYPEIYDMQVRAIAEAALACAGRGVKVLPEIMIPLVGFASELSFLRARAEAVIAEAVEGSRRRIPFRIGTMIEVPRAAVTAGRIAEHAEFFSFGTNDLTQMTCGISRDDMASFVPDYIDRKLIPRDPFQVLDRDGVGVLVRWAVEEGRRARKGLKVGICGEHGGDPESVAFCHEVGLDYVSCSPFRVPIARLAAAQAELRERGAAGKPGRGRPGRR